MKQTGKFCEYCVPQGSQGCTRFVQHSVSRMITYCKVIHALG